MTAALSPQLTESYEHADIKIYFFLETKLQNSILLKAANNHR